MEHSRVLKACPVGKKLSAPVAERLAHLLHEHGVAFVLLAADPLSIAVQVALPEEAADAAGIYAPELQAAAKRLIERGEMTRP